MNSCTRARNVAEDFNGKVAKPDSHLLGTVRSTPTSDPTINAMTHAVRERVTVHFRPSISQPK
jgi:hypothetical protein